MSWVADSLIFMLYALRSKKPLTTMYSTYLISRR